MQWYIGVHKLSQLTLSQLTQHSSTNTASTQEQMSVPLINSLEDVISIIGPLAGEGEEYQTLQIDAEKLRNGKQDEIRKLCKPWGVKLTERNLQGKYPKRSDADLKQRK